VFYDERAQVRNPKKKNKKLVRDRCYNLNYYDISIKSTVQAQKNQNRFPMLISYVQGAEKVRKRWELLNKEKKGKSF